MKKLLNRISEEIKLMFLIMFIIPPLGAIWLISFLGCIMFLIASC